jgi:hypothetical protein
MIAETMEIKIDDLSGPQIAELLGEHLRGQPSGNSI